MLTTGIFTFSNCFTHNFFIRYHFYLPHSMPQPRLEPYCLSKYLFISPSPTTPSRTFAPITTESIRSHGIAPYIVADKKISLDPNLPLEGKRLSFKIKLVSISSRSFDSILDYEKQDGEQRIFCINTILLKLQGHPGPFRILLLDIVEKYPTAKPLISSGRFMLLVTVFAINWSGAIRFEGHLGLLAAVRTRYLVHFPISAHLLYLLVSSTPFRGRIKHRNINLSKSPSFNSVLTFMSYVVDFSFSA